MNNNPTGINQYNGVRKAHLSTKPTAKRKASAADIRNTTVANRVWMSTYLKRMRKGTIPYQPALSVMVKNSTKLRNAGRKK